MNENLKQSVQDTIKRIGELNCLRQEVDAKANEVEVHTKDLSAIEKIKGVESDEYRVKQEVLNSAERELAETKSRLAGLLFKRSELKPIIDDLSKEFENELRSEQEREFIIEVGPRPSEDNKEDVDADGNLRPLTKDEQNTGRKAFKKLLDYLYNDVNWTAKTAAGLMVLVRNMVENKFWVRDNEFDNTIRLRSSNVLVLWKSILEDMSGKGYYAARDFLECWANCGKSISESVREIQKLHESSRQIGTDLTEIENEFERSENDIVPDGTLTTKDEVDPEV